MANGASCIKSVAVVGAGIIGLACALELADRDISVTLYEPIWPPRGASWAAAGMLAPAFEAIGQEDAHPDLYHLCEASAQLWPDWADRLERKSGLNSGYQPGPSIAVALNEEDAIKLRSVQDALAGHESPPEFCTDRLSEIEPSLSNDIVSALLLPTDGQVDNRNTIQALTVCAEQHPNISIKMGRPPMNWSGQILDHAGHDATLIAAGWQSGRIAVLRDGSDIAVSKLIPALRAIEPVSGQMLATERVDGGPKRTVRSGHVYIVPKSDRIIIGATSEPGRILKAPEAEQIERLHQKAIEICPALKDAPIIESWAGVRPGLKSHAPLIGETSLENVFVASGHYRNGILLAPLTAKIIADLMVDQIEQPVAKPFSPDRQFVAEV